jgi:hypothetical protein
MQRTLEHEQFVLSWLNSRRGSKPPQVQIFVNRINLNTTSGRIPLTRDRLIAEIATGQHSTQETDIHAPGGSRTRNPSRRSAADLRLRPAQLLLEISSEYVSVKSLMMISVSRV